MNAWVGILLLCWPAYLQCVAVRLQPEPTAVECRQAIEEFKEAGAAGATIKMADCQRMFKLELQ